MKTKNKIEEELSALINQYNIYKKQRLDLNNWFNLQEEYYQKTKARIDMLRWVLDYDLNEDI